MATAMASQTRPEPMNASPYHSKVRVTLKFADTQFAAGGMVAGKMELECKAEKGLGISVIMVELYAIEELTSRDHSATSTFLQSKRLFQGPGLPPSNSVHPYPAPGDPPLPSTYYHARRGITVFPFQFPLPESSPSSIEFGSGLARLRYEVRASVGVFWKGEKKLVTDKKPIDVVERFEVDFNRVDPEGVIVGESGKIWMQGKVIGGFLVAGQPACIELQVKNHSNKKNTALSVTLARELLLPNQSTQKPLQLSDTLTSVSFRGPEYIIQPGVEGVANLVVDIPKHARGVKGGRRQGEGNRSTESLFEVRCILGIKLAMGIGSKDIRLDLPVTVLHPSVVPDYPPPEMYAIPPAPMSAPLYDPTSGMMYQPPTSPAPYLDRPMSPYAYPVPPMSPPIAPYVDHGHVWLPPPSMSPMPPSIYPGSHYAHPASQYTSLVAPFVPPPRPSSAEPTPSQPLHGLPAGMPTVVPPPPLIPMPTGHNDGQREEGKGERASRIAHHLRMSSRHRSASPPAHRYHLADAPPAAHVHPTGTIALAAVPETLIAAQNATSSPPTSPEMHTRKNLTLSPLPTGGDVVSPRPMLSPKVSFSKDPFEQATQVAALERLAAQEEAHKNVAASLPPPPVVAPALSERSAGSDSRDKTLPKPPVPSAKEHVPAARSRADALFPPDLFEAGVDETPPTPTLAAAVTSLKVPRNLRGGPNGSGLDALEARLLAEVGTRKPERARVPDVRTVLPNPITIPRANDVEPPVDSAISSLTLPTLDIDADEKTLKRGNVSRGGGSDREHEHEHEHEHDAELELGATSTARARDSKGTTTRGRESRDTKRAGGSGGARRRTERAEKGDKDKGSSKHTADADGGAGKDKELQKLRKAAQGRIAAWLGSIDPEEPPQSATPPPETPPPVTPSPRRGRSPTRVSKSPVRVSRSPARSPAISPARSAAVTPEPPASPLREKKSEEVVLKNVPGSSPKSKEEPQETQAAPNPRSSGFLPIGTVRANQAAKANVVKFGKKSTPFDAYLLPKASPKLGVYPPRPLDSEVKYDVRSARGGKGGIVTSVAAIWASAGQTQPGDKAPIAKPVPVKPQPKPARLAEQWKAKTGLDASSPTTKATPPVPKPKPDALKSPTLSTSPASFDGRPKAMRPTPKTATSSPAVTSAASDPMVQSVADLTARRARMIKSPSVPAVVSSSTATPMLSSTASLARPSPMRVDRNKLNVKLPPTISEAETRTDTSNSTSGTPAAGTKSPGSPPAKGEYAFGQARLRELIKRYQGQVNSS
ncbi:hypothetical protein C8Q76DRAFT_818795 [Earliella scabrosa]|nr:hypothetical protein C8Q76DRAFT_818795 [Earliella scabrosa]